MIIEQFFDSFNTTNRLVDDCIRNSCAGLSFWAKEPDLPYIHRLNGYLDNLESQYGTQLKAFISLQQSYEDRYKGILNSITNNSTSSNENIGEAVSVNNTDTTPFDLINKLDNQDRQQSTGTNNSTQEQFQTADKFLKDLEIINGRIEGIQFKVVSKFKHDWLNCVSTYKNLYVPNVPYFNITKQPLDTTGYAGNKVTLTVGYDTNVAVYLIEWYVDGVKTKSSTDNFVEVETKVGETKKTVYCIIVCDELEDIRSDNANIDLTPLPEITIVTQPVGQSVQENQPFTFSIVANSNYGTLAYQWCVNDNPVIGATTAVWTSSLPTNGRYKITCLLTVDGYKLFKRSDVAVLDVEETVLPPDITITKDLPATALLPINEVYTFEITAESSGSLSYKWFNNGTQQASTTNTWSLNVSGGEEIYCEITSQNIAGLVTKETTHCSVTADLNIIKDFFIMSSLGKEGQIKYLEETAKETFTMIVTNGINTITYDFGADAPKSTFGVAGDVFVAPNGVELTISTAVSSQYSFRFKLSAGLPVGTYVFTKQVKKPTYRLSTSPNFFVDSGMALQFEDDNVREDMPCRIVQTGTGSVYMTTNDYAIWDISKTDFINKYITSYALKYINDISDPIIYAPINDKGYNNMIITATTAFADKWNTQKDNYQLEFSSN